LDFIISPIRSSLELEAQCLNKVGSKNDIGVEVSLEFHLISHVETFFVPFLQSSVYTLFCREDIQHTRSISIHSKYEQQRGK
jgi:hypothetical protein